MAPVKLRGAINAHAPQFTGNDQHDSQELLSFVIDGLHEDLNRVKKKPYVEKKDSDGRPDCVVAKESWDGHLLRNQSIMVDLFNGQIKSEVRCKSCQFSSVSFDAFSMLTLPLPTENSAIMNIVLRKLSSEIPTHYAVEVERDATYRDLKLALAGLCGIPVQRLAFIDALGTGTQKLAADEEKPRIRTASMLACYEVVPQKESAVVDEAATEGGAGAKVAGTVVAGAAGAAAAEWTVVEADGKAADTAAAPAAGKAGEASSPRAASSTCASASASLAPASVSNSRPQSRSASPAPLPQLPPPPKNGLVLPGHLVILHRRQDQHQFHCLANTIKTSVFGNGFVCATPDGLTAQMLYEEVWHRAKRFIREPSDAAAPSAFPFTLKMVDAYGSRCSRCRWNRFCHGCTLAKEDKPLPEDLVSVAIDWDPTVLHLSYDYSSEHKMESHKSVGELKKKSEEPISLEDCLKAFTKEEQLGLEDSWYCSKCKEHREATKKLDIWTLPPVLIVHLKRFHNVNGRWVKSQRQVKMPLKDLNVFAHLTPPKWVPYTPDSAGGETEGATAKEGAAQEEDGGGGGGAGGDGENIGRDTVHRKEPETENGNADGDDDGNAAAAASTVATMALASKTAADDGANTADVTPTPSSNPSPEPPEPPEPPAAAAPAAADGGGGGGMKISWDKLDPHASRYVDPNCDRVYDLSAMSIHLGIMGGGHYVAYGKNPKDQWVFFNDSSAREVPDERVGKENGYCLFYTARGLDPASFLPEKQAGDDHDDDDDADGRGSPDGDGRNCAVM